MPYGYFKICGSPGMPHGPWTGSRSKGRVRGNILPVKKISILPSSRASIALRRTTTSCDYFITLIRHAPRSRAVASLRHAVAGRLPAYAGSAQVGPINACAVLCSWEKGPSWERPPKAQPGRFHGAFRASSRFVYVEYGQGCGQAFARTASTLCSDRQQIRRALKLVL